jgi:hypothetical protein
MRFGGFLLLLATWVSAHSLTAATIDTILLSNFGGYSDTYTPGTFSFNAPSEPLSYQLSDGTSWQSGAGSFGWGHAMFSSVSLSGSTLSYTLATNSPVAEMFTDFDGGNHSAQGQFDFASPLILQATLGSNTATLSGELQVISNDITWYGEPRFNYFTAPVGAIVPFQMTYRLTSGAWELNTFDSSFNYFATGSIDIASSASTPEPSDFFYAFLSAGMLAVTLRLRKTA